MSQPPKDRLEIGTVLNSRWKVLEFVAKGGMGQVYRAQQLNLKRDIAIKGYWRFCNKKIRRFFYA